jgi:hypothetical protein
MRTPWQKSVLTVTNDEIVIIIHDKIIFCDLNGVEQKKSTINYVTRRAPGVTSKNIYIYLDNDVIHKYQRNL